MRRPFLAPFVVILLLAATVIPSQAQAPEYVSYQGTLSTGGMSYNGPAEFKFVIFDDANNSVWSNDATSLAGAEPTASVTVLVIDGVFSVLLGHPDQGMVPLLPEFLHEAAAPHLRVWVDTGGGFEQMDDVALASAPFALEALVAHRALGGFFVDGELHTLGGIRFPDDTVQLTAATGSGSDADWTISGNDMYSAASGNVGIGTTTPQFDLEVADEIAAKEFIVTAPGGQVAILKDNGSGGGALELNGPGGGNYNDRGCWLSGGGTNGAGYMQLYNTNGSSTVQLEGDHGNGGGFLQLGNDSVTTSYLWGNGNEGGASFLLLNSVGQLTFRARGHAYGSGSQLETFDSSGSLAHQFTSSLREMKVYDSGGTEQVRLNGQDSGGELRLWQDDAHNGVILDGDAGGHGLVRVYDDAGSISVEIIGEDAGGQGRVRADVFEIIGGSDLSEQFDISAAGGGAQPGMTVSIDPAAPGRLTVSQVAYDHKVAGIVSGAGGVRPGLLMGQEGSLADGKYPVALTGRVWTWCDASGGAIEPGDLLTTSARPGHAMKVADRGSAPGATLGKAMSSLESGQGLVLVLVNLQ